MPLTKGYKQLLDEAYGQIETVPINDALALLGDDGVQFVDIRDVREVHRTGTIPGAFHAPRGMLEFWVDPESPYYKDVFGSGKKFVFFCASAWRSALATKALQDMGLGPVAHLEGGFTKWKDSGAPVQAPEEREGR
jgi:rhodanese-related sulfurtransferase